MERKFYIHTFGCQMNVHDSSKMAGILGELGYLQASADIDANLILFNTCTVRDHAHHKAISEIGRAVAKKQHRPSLIVGVCGCVAQEEKGHLFEIYPELDFVIGPDQIHQLKFQIPNLKSQINSKLQSPNSKVIATELIDDPDEYNWINIHPLPRPPPSRGREGERGRVSEFVTITKGCNNKCSFCIVPHVRGAEVSKPADDIIVEVRELAECSVKEVTLLGQNVNSYNPPQPSLTLRLCSGQAKGGRGGISSFVHLLHRIAFETNILRIRYTSPHPKDLSDDLINEHATNPKLCRHMHLPLQAGSDKILRAMKRSYNKKQFVDKAARLRERTAHIEITTDIIVGFPGETEADFLDTMSVVKEVVFDGMFAFKYSPRPGTKAAELKDDVPQKEKEERLQRLLELNASIWKKKTQKLLGTTQQVLVEGVSKKHVIARERERPKQSHEC